MKGLEKLDFEIRSVYNDRYSIDDCRLAGMNDYLFKAAAWKWSIKAGSMLFSIISIAR